MTAPHITPKSREANDYTELVFRRLGLCFQTLPDDHPDVINEKSNHVARVGPVLITWYRGYWKAHGRVSIDVARRVYLADVNKAIRSGGHGGALSPDNYGCDWFDAEGRMIVVDPDGSQLRDFQRIPLLRSTDLSVYRFVSSLEDVPDRRGFVDCYHIDTEEGLGLFVAMVRYAKQNDHGSVFPGVRS